MRSSRWTRQPALPACLLIAIIPAQADSPWEDAFLGYTLKGGLQYKRYNFDQSFRAGPASFERELEAYIPTFSVSGGVGYGPVYLAVKYEDAITDGSTGKTEDFDGTEVRNDIERRDASVTLGYNVWQGLDLFIGWLDGETTLDTTSVIDEDFEEAGPFIGFIYGWQVGDYGSLAANLAYASMDGKVTLTDKTGDNFEGGEREIEDDSTGYSLALTWSAPLSDALGYYVDLRYQLYEIDTSDDEFDDFEVDEEIGSITVGLQYFF